MDTDQFIDRMRALGEVEIRRLASGTLVYGKAAERYCAEIEYLANDDALITYLAIADAFSGEFSTTRSDQDEAHRIIDATLRGGVTELARRSKLWVIFGSAKAHAADDRTVTRKWCPWEVDRRGEGECLELQTR